jgi:hypothetical protein
MSTKTEIGCWAFAAPIVVAGWLLGVLLLYGIVVIIFRYAFGVELWNPFH